MLDTVARKILPIKARQVIGLWGIKQASKNIHTLRWFIWAIHGYKVGNNLKLIPNNRAVYYYQGHRIAMPRDGVGASLEIFQGEVYDRHLKVSEGGIVIDIGAYVGMFSVKAALKAKLVLAIEPSMENCKMVIGNTSGMGNVMVVNQAVSDYVGYGCLNVSNASACHSLVYDVGKEHQKVSVTTIDALLREHVLDKEPIDFIKIDAEGSEMAALKGAKETLKRTSKVSVAAYHTMPNGEGEIQSVVDLLVSAGFRVIKDKGLRSYVYAVKD